MRKETNTNEKGEKIREKQMIHQVADFYRDAYSL